MTIAICLKINDGLVLASDSATTILGQVPNGQLMALNVYNNANKVFNLRKGFPVGAIAWGAGSIGHSSISTLLKDLRVRLSGTDPERKDWELKGGSYTVEEAATRLKQFIFEELYEKEFRDFPHQKPSLGFIVAGYSAKAQMADEFQIDIQNGRCTGPRRLRNREDVGLTWAGEPEALNRLIMGYSPALLGLLQAQLGVPAAQVSEVMARIQPQIQFPLVLPAMPLQDAIELARFMAELTVEFSRFKPGAPTVGGPIEVAAISKHEGFRWVQRKYYFQRELNPEEDVDYNRRADKPVQEPRDEGNKRGELNE